MQLTHLFLFAFSLTLFFLSCKKDPHLIEEILPIPQEDPIPEFGTFKQSDNISNNTISNDLQNVRYVLEIEQMTTELILNTFFATYFFPQLRDIMETPQADTRNNCPDASLLTGSTGQPDILTLTYSNCTSASSVTYDGVVKVTIDGEMETLNTSVLIELGSGLTISEKHKLTGSISMTYGNNGSYEISSLDIKNTNSDPTDPNFDTFTQAVNDASLGAAGEIAVRIVNTNTTPIHLVDDIFIYDGATLKVFCPDGTELIASTGTELDPITGLLDPVPLEFTLDCGTPKVGKITLEAINLDLTTRPHSEIDFSYSTTTTGGCDNEVEVTLDSDPFNPTIINL